MSLNSLGWWISWTRTGRLSSMLLRYATLDYSLEFASKVASKFWACGIRTSSRYYLLGTLSCSTTMDWYRSTGVWFRCLELVSISRLPNAAPRFGLAGEEGSQYCLKAVTPRLMEMK